MPSIRLSMAGSPPRIEVTREDVADSTWDEIATRIADDLPRAGAPLIVRPGKLLRERRSLRALLLRHQVDLRPDGPTVALLRQTANDDGALAAAISNPDATLPVPAKGDAIGELRLTRELRDFQKRDLGRLLFLRHGANFSVPGAGKTTVAYVLHAIERSRTRVDRMLVVCPISAFDAWENEVGRVFQHALTVARWRGGPMPRTDVVLTNYQRLPGALDTLCDWMAFHRVHLVVDEAHRAKRGTIGEWGRALLTLAPLAQRRDVLTGTPAPNHPKDVIALFDMLWPSGAASRRLPSDALRTDPPLSAMSDLNTAVSPLFVRTKKVELQLPPLEFNPIVVTPGPLQREIYAALRNRYAGMFELDRRDQDTFRKMGEVLMYLLQAASSPRLLSEFSRQARPYRYPPLAIPPGSRLAKLVDTYAEHEVPPKIAQACALLRANAAEGKKTLVWSNFPGNLLDLEQQVAALEPALIYGEIPTRESDFRSTRNREDELERFRIDDRCKVLLANPAAMSEGVSLHEVCHDAIYIDRTFNAGQYLQSLDRIHRLGLPPGTRTKITLLLGKGTIDEAVDRRVADKTQRLAGLLDDPHLVALSLPDDEDYGDPVDETDDLEEILAHLREGRSDERVP
ncbi:MAG: DEAD/DEAH box helicase [bacterium]|nr:DEAD/DEAH box helicase [bacterium]